jgi:hypothetical protein
MRERVQKLRDRRPVVSSLRARIDDDPRRIDDEVAAELQRVATWAAKTRAMRELARVSSPHARIAPDAEDRAASKTPGPVRRPIAVGQHRVRNVESAQQRVAKASRTIEGDEEGGAEFVDPLPVVEHLHEVRAADQSPGVAEEDEEEGLPAQVV